MLAGILGYLWLILLTWIALMLYTGGIFERRTGGACLAVAIVLPILLLLPLAILRHRRVLTLTLLIAFGIASVLAMAGYGIMLIR